MKKTPANKVNKRIISHSLSIKFSAITLISTIRWLANH